MENQFLHPLSEKYGMRIQHDQKTANCHAGGKMKVGILTFPNSTSHGASLQMYALYRAVAEAGCEVEIINYFNSYMKAQKHLDRIRGAIFLEQLLRVNAARLIHRRKYREFAAFEKAMTKYPPRPVSSSEPLIQIGERYDAVICGSDQVWNPDITDSDLSYFLNFCGEKTARISYAPSFGVEKLSSEYAGKVSRELERFQALSVRETEGQKLIKEITGLDSQLVVDPTMLFDGEWWTEHEKYHPCGDGEYILYYTVRSSEALWQHCLRLAEELDMKVIRIGSNFISKGFKENERVKYACDVGPQEWLYLVHNASYVVTNSFHGTAFAINYRKDFCVEFSSHTNSRLANIVRLFGLESQVFDKSGSQPSKKTDYTATELRLPKFRERSITFLNKALMKQK